MASARIEAVTQPVVSNLPTELLFRILTFLEVPDVLAFRKTCKFCHDLSHDRGLWLDLFRLQHAGAPRPLDARDEPSLLSLTASRIEAITLSAYKVEKEWLSPRQQMRPVNIDGHGTVQDILHLALLLDKMALCVYNTGAVSIWDLEQKMQLCLQRSPPRVQWDPAQWTSAFACADTSNDAVYLAITRAHMVNERGSASATVLMRIPIDGPDSTPAKHSEITGGRGSETNHDVQFDHVDTLFGAEGQTVRTLDTSRKLIAFSRSSFIDIVHWPTNTSISINAQTEELEELWNGIIGLQFVGTHLLCLKARSLVLYDISYPFPSDMACFSRSALGPPPPPPAPAPSTFLRPTALHIFPSTSFRNVSISQPLSDPQSTTMMVSFLGNDVLRGVFHYRLALILPAPPLVHIERVGVHNVATDGPARSSFIGAVAMGLQMRRGVWIERIHSSTRRRVIVFSTPGLDAPESSRVPLRREVDLGGIDSETVDDDEESAGGGLWEPIDARVAYEMNSWDLREDLMHVAFSEITGRIVLGMRSGDVHVI